MPFLAGVTMFGVAVCSTRFLGASFLGALAIGGAAGFVVYSVKRRKPSKPGPVPVALGRRH